MKGQGPGTWLMLSIIEQARRSGLAEIVGLILAENSNMLRLMASLNFKVAAFAEDADFKITTPAL